MKISKTISERFQKLGSRSGRGFLVFWRAMPIIGLWRRRGFEKSRNIGKTEPKRSQNPKRPPSGSFLPNGCKIFETALDRHAFTLLELLVVIAIIAILAALLFPALSHAKQHAEGSVCLSRGKQMMTAIVMYTGDYSDYYPPNPDDGNMLPGYNWCCGEAGINQPQEFDPDILQDPTRSLLMPFLSGSVGLFRCPADRRQGVYDGTNNPALVGKIVPAARTFSMNQAVGTIDPGFNDGGAHSGVPTLSVNGPWLNNQHNHQRNSPWLTFGKSSQVRLISPSLLWVLLDEDATDLNDAAFGFGMQDPEWIDIPGTYHNGGCGFDFADGHSETHRWFYRNKVNEEGQTITNPGDLADWQWMQQRTSIHD
jgi:prepilin-type N-terminal cleavage/methylation domain-containing protein